MAIPDHLSVIIPTTDSFEALRAHIQRLDCETSQRIELVIVSPDTTLNEAALTDGVRFHSAQMVLGQDVSQPDAINLGAQRATGAAFTWLNVDDLLTDDAVATVLSALANAPDDAIIHGKANRRHPDGSTDDYPVTSQVSLASLFQSCGLSQPATWITPGAFRKAGGLRPRFDCAFDYDFWIRANLAGVPFIYLDTPLAEMDIRPQAKSFVRRARVFQEHCELMMLHYGRCPPNILTALWAEALSPAESFASVSQTLLDEAGKVLKSISETAASTGDDQTLKRLESDARLHFLARGIAADINSRGEMPDRAQIRVRADLLPISLLFRFESPPEDPGTVAVLLQPDARPMASALYPSVGFMAARIEEDAAIGDDGFVQLSFLSTEATGARLIDAW